MVGCLSLNIELSHNAAESHNAAVTDHVAVIDNVAVTDLVYCQDTNQPAAAEIEMLGGIDDAIEYSPNPLGQQQDRPVATQMRAAHLAASKRQQARRQEVRCPPE